MPSWLKSPGVIWTGASLALFLIVPWLTITLIHSDAGMAVCLLLFYAVDPVFAIAAGMFAGKRPRQLWFLPILIPVLFLLGSWVCFDFGQPDFISYAIMYAMLCGATMFIFLIMTNGRKR